MATLDIYEVDPCHRGDYDEEHARFVAAGDADEAAYKVAGEHLHSEGNRRKLRLRVRRIGNGSPRRSCFTPPEAASGRSRRAPCPCQRELNRNSNSFRKSGRTVRSRGRRNQVRTCRLSMMKISRVGQDRLLPAPLLRQAPNLSSFHSRGRNHRGQLFAFGQPPSRLRRDARQWCARAPGHR